MPASDEADVRGFRALAAGADREAHALSIHRRLQAAATERGNVQEHVRAALVRRDEAEAAVGIEELHGAVIGAFQRAAVAVLEAAATGATIAAAEAAAVAAAKAAAVTTEAAAIATAVEAATVTAAVEAAATELIARRARCEAARGRRRRRSRR